MGRDPRRVLVVSHGHPDEWAGGGEIFAHELYTSLRAVPGLEAGYLFARDLEEGEDEPQAAVLPYGGRAGEWWFPFRVGGEFATDYSLFDDTRTCSEAFRRGLTAFLAAFSPDVIHFHHYFRVGGELLLLVRRTLPEALTCLTLHDLKVLCPDNGYMLRRHERRWPGGIHELCPRPTLDRCLECCDGRSRVELGRRLVTVRAMLDAVDLYIVPSRFVLERYAEWGVPRERLALLDYGRVPPATRSSVPPERRPPDRFAFFGRPVPPKGLHVLIEAIELLARSHRRVPTLYINAPDLADDRNLTGRLAGLAARLPGRIHYLGGYAQAELADRMARTDWVVVPSVWWENSPLVIQEAFLHGRPVICSDVGGMAEKVRHGVDGLHFRVGDAGHLAETIAAASASTGLWRRLAAGRPRVPTIEQARDGTLALYRRAVTAGRRP